MVGALIDSIKLKICETRIKLLKAEVKHKKEKVKKHEMNLLALECRLRKMKDDLQKD